MTKVYYTTIVQSIFLFFILSCAFNDVGSETEIHDTENTGTITGSVLISAIENNSIVYRPYCEDGYQGGIKIVNTDFYIL